MIHDAQLQSGGEPHGWQSQSARFSDGQGNQAVPGRYVFVPDSLITAFAHDPLTIGVYVAIARLSFVAKDAVPLAARELTAWMGSERDADRAAIMRRIVKLEERGWIVITRAMAAKHHLLPTWGRDQAGCVRPWCFNHTDCGRPEHIRGRRVPVSLLDDYIGRLDPQPGHHRALVCRYFTQPLLDLVDIGIYAVGMRAEIAPTPRLQHLGLYHKTLVQPPQNLQTLLQQAECGQLTTLVDDVTVPVTLSIQGATRIGISRSLQAQEEPFYGEQMRGSLSGSVGRSTDGSSDVRQGNQVSQHSEGKRASTNTPVALIAWDVRIVNQEINSISADQNQLALSGGDIAQEQQKNALSANVAEGHRTLNTDRTILLGEWYELLALQHEQGAEQLLIWQARAKRATTPRPQGIDPAYYQACAARAALDQYQPPEVPRQSTAAVGNIEQEIPVRDPTRDELLRTMGIRERKRLANVPLDVIAAWQNALVHPGFAAQFTSPIGFAVSQMCQKLLPPTVDELDQWAERGRQKTDPYQSERHVTATTITTDALAAEQRLEARVRELTPLEADVETLCEIAQMLEAGATDATINAYLQAIT